MFNKIIIYGILNRIFFMFKSFPTLPKLFIIESTLFIYNI
jgi:hypothetical protein